VLTSGTNIFSRLNLSATDAYMKTAIIKHGQSMDQGQNENAESPYLAYLQLVEDGVQNLAVVDHVVLCLRIKFTWKTPPKISIMVGTTL
jgi:hypothetical protein